MTKKFIPTLFTVGRLLCCGLILVATRLSAAEKQPVAGGMEIKFTTAREGTVLVNIYNGDGTLARRLVQGEHFAKGAQKLAWDGLLDDGTTAPPGDYTWKGVFHEGIGLKLRGWVGSGGGLPWTTPDGKGGWGGDKGVPSAVATDEKQVYLGWSLADNGKSVLACDLDGRVLWSHRRSEGPSGCKALAVDDGIVYVLGGLEGAAARGGGIYRLNAKDGTPVLWPNGAMDLKMSSLWPADGKTRPDMADAMTVRHGHIYLSFTSSQFLTVLDAKSGAYLQTVVGAPPGMIDVVPTQTELPDAPGKLSDADFAVISLGDGVLGRILFAHDPFWLITSDMAQLEKDATVSALTVIGDHGKFHARTAFIGYGAPRHQVQARSLLNMDEPVWIAGRPGGRGLLGPWQADGLRAVRGVALAPDGRLWVAESDAFPKRFSVWDTTGKQGKLVREFFGPAEPHAPGGAINPLNPDLMVAQNCEWRIDRKTGAATCVGVILRDRSIGCARFGIGKNGHAYLVTAEGDSGTGPIRILERAADGDYRVRARIYWTLENGKEAPVTEMGNAKNTVFWSDKNGDGVEQDSELLEVSSVLEFDLPWTGSDLALHYRIREDARQDYLLKVSGWTTGGAPQFDLEKSVKLPRNSTVRSADGKLFLETPTEAGKPLVCREAAEGRKLWELPASNVELARRGGGTVRLAPPLNSAWVVGLGDGMWHVITEDGFALGSLFAREAAEVRWPQSAVPGADMTHADAKAANSGSVVQTADGKVYLEAGDSAYWNLELTGLEKAKAIPGGKITVSATK
ncbi:MAG TPA: FlgD immunoglobulin-like domain containing protein [Chthoniobacter sp.]|nr:FlgD immunoglobulin-like domain containing protein [Chthoniobacter sp.]